ncbi:putative zinc-binding metallopeptidase [Ciceribacter sp. L1K22]|uniref:zinc-binding metallopeptidase family protein n=1 Tax=Ciceribacter sp. L1K22 TaxID=2820275 RepID=UPI001ABDA9D0|nr:putative zinc-binding metallopeptidase [Ciceribacter sp. L1K22]MBO3758716.1 putative zinc-binding metallopeptidase [Ciceribacter sp. L1K22]
MKPYTCSNCGNLVHFDNEVCVQCGLRLGYRCWSDDMVALDPAGQVAVDGQSTAQSAFLCENAAQGVCNWLVEDAGAARLCRACRHNVVIPDLAVEGNVERWARMEQAKRYVIYSLRRWDLPLPGPDDAGNRHLSFSFLADVQNLDGGVEPVMTGHDSGHITINVAEADDAERERIRTEMKEPYRTLVGHFRHELGHFYWDVLVDDGGRLEQFRSIFGDERQDYGQALMAHYEHGAAADWPNRFVSAYASAHPWEDFAETWAHYIHMTDGLETALSFGLRLTVGASLSQPRTDGSFDPYRAASAEDLTRRWIPVSIALNSINRSMGQPDVYPFVLSPPVIEKLEFIHSLVQRNGRPGSAA